MKEQEKQTLVININLTRGLITLLTLALLAVAFLGYLAWDRHAASASGPQAPAAAYTGMRRYYQTASSYNGAAADTACASGYHMASLWEILDPSNLTYDTNLGYQIADSGQGPPVNYVAWVRTGWSSSGSSTAGDGNCNAWSSSSGSVYGTYVSLPNNWTVGQEIGVWDVDTNACSFAMSVWCVED